MLTRRELDESIIDSISSWWLSLIQSLYSLLFSNSFTFQASGLTVYFSPQDPNAGEGAYSIVLKARAAYEAEPTYALKKMLLQSSELVDLANNEIEAFQKFKHKNIIKLVAHEMVADNGYRIAYLLFPLMKRGSLRDVVTGTGDRDSRSLANVLAGFLDICEAARTLHDYEPSYVHQDIKLENVLMDSRGNVYLIDLGSVRPANIRINNRKDALRVAEEAGQHSTASYRAPELYDPPRDCTLDCRTDVWSLGCLLFAWWFGYSPFECEFAGNSPRVVECSSLRVLAAIPRPSDPSRADLVVLELVQWVLVKDFSVRPHTVDLINRVRELLHSVRAGDSSV